MSDETKSEPAPDHEYATTVATEVMRKWDNDDGDVANLARCYLQACEERDTPLRDLNHARGRLAEYYDHLMEASPSTVARKLADNASLREERDRLREALENIRDNAGPPGWISVDDVRKYARVALAPDAPEADDEDRSETKMRPP